MGWCYATGDGIEKNEAEALRWYKKAADLGDDFSKTELAKREKTPAATPNRP
jgi:hypothetical protein